MFDMNVLILVAWLVLILVSYTLSLLLLKRLDLL